MKCIDLSHPFLGCNTRSFVVGEFCVLFYVLLDKIPLIPGRLAPDSAQLTGKCCFLHCFPNAVESSTVLEDPDC